MKIAVLLQTLFMLPASHAADGLFNISQFCANGITVEQLVEVINTLGPLAGPARKQCGLYGESAAICSDCTNEVSDKQREAVLPMLSDPGHRKWHSEFHHARTALHPEQARKLLSGTTAKCPILEDRDKWVEGWMNAGMSGNVPARLVEDGATIAGGYFARKKMSEEEKDAFLEKHNAFDGSVSGEDFLKMHRQMIKMMQVSLTKQDQPCISGWKNVPESDDKIWPTPFAQGKKKLDPMLPIDPQQPWGMSPEDQQNFNQKAANRWLQYLRQDSYLKKVSLNNLGRCIEYSVHAFLHNQYADPKFHCKSTDDASESCNDLLPTFSSHTNPHFWKLHGMIDNLIEDWLKARGKTELSDNCNGRKSCVEWSKDSWIGDIPEVVLSGEPAKRRP